ncbi:hypothetical protein [Streptomyces aculeolatus]|uniref:hypothetical protein n=1 Tax=Streptomyces aculeolatus TaxID=270689 RepID=UPI00355834C9
MPTGSRTAGSRASAARPGGRNHSVGGQLRTAAGAALRSSGMPPHSSQSSSPGSSAAPPSAIRKRIRPPVSPTGPVAGRLRSTAQPASAGISSTSQRSAPADSPPAAGAPAEPAAALVPEPAAAPVAVPVAEPAAAPAAALVPPVPVPDPFRPRAPLPPAGPGLPCGPVWRGITEPVTP